MSGPDESAGVRHHHASAPKQVPTAVVTVSDTRTLETDTGGALAVELLEGAGHPIRLRRIVPDDAAAIAQALDAALADVETRAVLFTGGTGVAPRDVTPDALEPRLERIVPGFGEFFRALSFEEIGSSALLSRALCGLVDGRVVFVLPGSRGAVRLGLERLVLPEIGHLAHEARKTS